MDQAVCEGCVRRMRLSLGNLTEKLQLLFPLADFISNILGGEVVGTQGSTQIRAASGGDIDVRISKEGHGLIQMPFLCYQPGFQGIGMVAKGRTFSRKEIPPDP